jgi:hypothetical protein
VLAILAIAFALPAARSNPHDVPIGAAGPQAAGTGPGFPAGVGESRTSSSNTLPARSRSPITPARPRCATRSAPGRLRRHLVQRWS